MESQIVEYKESWRDEYLKWICGFANAEGGKILIGVNDDGTVCGVSDAKRLIEDIPNKVKNALAIVPHVNLLEKRRTGVHRDIRFSISIPCKLRRQVLYAFGCDKPVAERAGS